MRSMWAPFRIDSTGRVMTTTDQRTIVEQQITNIVVTNQLERTNRPAFGGGLQGALFEPLDELTLADREADVAGRCNESLTMARIVQIEMRADHGHPASGESTRTTLAVDIRYYIPPADQALTLLTIPFTSLLSEESGF
jgi:phage baseplate assembly protein W